VLSTIDTGREFQEDVRRRSGRGQPGQRTWAPMHRSSRTTSLRRCLSRDRTMWPAPAPTSWARCGGWAPTAPTYLYCQTPWMRLRAITAGAATATSSSTSWRAEPWRNVTLGRRDGRAAQGRRRAGRGPPGLRGAAWVGIASHYRLTVLFGRLIGRPGRNGLPAIRGRSTRLSLRDPSAQPALAVDPADGVHSCRRRSPSGAGCSSSPSSCRARSTSM
jgi:hypothetical protein